MQSCFKYVVLIFEQRFKLGLYCVYQYSMLMDKMKMGWGCQTLRNKKKNLGRSRIVYTWQVKAQADYLWMARGLANWISSMSRLTDV